MNPVGQLMGVSSSGALAPSPFLQPKENRINAIETKKTTIVLNMTPLLQYRLWSLS